MNQMTALSSDAHQWSFPVLLSPCEIHPALNNAHYSICSRPTNHALQYLWVLQNRQYQMSQLIHLTLRDFKNMTDLHDFFGMRSITCSQPSQSVVRVEVTSTIFVACSFHLTLTHKLPHRHGHCLPLRLNHSSTTHHAFGQALGEKNHGIGHGEHACGSCTGEQPPVGPNWQWQSHVWSFINVSSTEWWITKAIIFTFSNQDDSLTFLHVWS